jgi:hypothetical protein
MRDPIRHVHTLVLRLWREPGDRDDDAGWRGLVRPLSTSRAMPDTDTASFHDLDNLANAVRSLLVKEEALPRTPPDRGSGTDGDKPQ